MNSDTKLAPFLAEHLSAPLPLAEWASHGARGQYSAVCHHCRLARLVGKLWPNPLAGNSRRWIWSPWLPPIPVSCVWSHGQRHAAGHKPRHLPCHLRRTRPGRPLLLWLPLRQVCSTMARLALTAPSRQDYYAEKMQVVRVAGG